MQDFREDIKDKYISGLNIVPIEYDKKRGYIRAKRGYGKSDYIWDEADKIILDTVENLYIKRSNKKRQLYRTFMLLYDCRSIEEAQKWLAKGSKELEKNTIKTYIKRIKKALNDAIIGDQSIKERIETEIRRNYGGKK